MLACHRKHFTRAHVNRAIRLRAADAPCADLWLSGISLAVGVLLWLQHLLLPFAGLLIIGFVRYEMDPAASKLGAVWVLSGGIYYAILTLRGASVPIGGVPPG